MSRRGYDGSDRERSSDNYRRAGWLWADQPRRPHVRGRREAGGDESGRSGRGAPSRGANQPLIIGVAIVGAGLLIALAIVAGGRSGNETAARRPGPARRPVANPAPNYSGQTTAVAPARPYVPMYNGGTSENYNQPAQPLVDDPYSRRGAPEYPAAEPARAAPPAPAEPAWTAPDEPVASAAPAATPAPKPPRKKKPKSTAAPKPKPSATSASGGEEPPGEEPAAGPPQEPTPTVDPDDPGAEELTLGPPRPSASEPEPEPEPSAPAAGGGGWRKIVIAAETFSTKSKGHWTFEGGVLKGGSGGGAATLTTVEEFGNVEVGMSVNYTGPGTFALRLKYHAKGVPPACHWVKIKPTKGKTVEILIHAEGGQTVATVDGQPAVTMGTDGTPPAAAPIQIYAAFTTAGTCEITNFRVRELGGGGGATAPAPAAPKPAVAAAAGGAATAKKTLSPQPAKLDASGLLEKQAAEQAALDDSINEMKASVAKSIEEMKTPPPKGGTKKKN